MKDNGFSAQLTNFGRSTVSRRRLRGGMKLVAWTASVLVCACEPAAMMAPPPPAPPPPGMPSPLLDVPKNPVMPMWIHRGASTWYPYSASIFNNPPNGVSVSTFGTVTPGTQMCVRGANAVVDFVNQMLLANPPPGTPSGAPQWQVDCSQVAYETQITAASGGSPQHYAAFVTFQNGVAGSSQYATYWVPYGSVANFQIVATSP